MRRFLGVVALCAVAIMAGSGSAQADKAFSPTCGNSGGVGASAAWLQHYYNAGDPYFEASWFQTCGDHKTVEWEIQWSDDGGLHWNDNYGSEDYIYTTSTGNAGDAIQPIYDVQPAGNCGSHNQWRLKVWDGKPSSSTISLGGGC